MKMSKISIAITHMDSMVTFYNAVFGSNLQPIPETPFYAGNLFGVQLLFAPNSIVEVKAEKNRIQFDVLVEDLDSLLASVQQSGGSLYDDRSDTDSMIIQGIQDPDGNSFVLIQHKS